MPINIDDPLPLPLAGRYAFPQDASAVLPVVIGDFISSTHVPADDEDGGFLPAVCIDRLNWVYCLNAIPNLNSPIRIYANDTRQADSVYTYTPMGDYAGIGQPIAYVQFLVNPGSREISWRGLGARHLTTGAGITNPIDALAEVFGRFGGWQASDIDYSSAAETRRLMNILGDTANMVFAESRSYREWLEIYLQQSYHVDLSMDVNGRLAVLLDTSVTNQPTTVLYTLDARTDLAGVEAEPLHIRRDPQDIVTQITGSWRRKWTTGDYTRKDTVSYAPGVSIHGTRHRAYELPGLYSEAQGIRWLHGMWMRYGIRADVVTFTVRGLSLMSAMPGMFLGMTSPKRGWNVPQLLKILNMDIDDENQEITFECFDCQRPVDVAATLPVVVLPQTRRRPIQGTPTVDLTPPAAASNLVPEGSYRRVVLRWRTPGDLDYSHTEIWASGLNNRATAVFVRNGGVGVPPGQTCEETFEVPEGAIYYVWLMTVDRDGNGANGGTGVTGGNWYPASATNGVLATTALVPTTGIEHQAITFTYGTSATIVAGVYTGETPIAQSILGQENPQGDVIAFGNAFATIGAEQVLVLRIRRGAYDPTGAIIGINYISNPLLVDAPVRTDVWGLDFDPAFNATYYLTAQVVNLSGAQVSFTVNVPSAALFLRHTKR